MAQSYKIKEVNIQLASGINLTVEVDSVQQLKELITDLKQVELLNFKASERKRNNENDEEKPDEKIDKENKLDSDNPLTNIEEKAELQANSLTAKKVLGFKNENPQILKPTSIKSADAILILLFALEYGLNKAKVSLDEFKTIYESQGIKSGSPLSMTVNNLKNLNYLDKKVYDSSRELTLNARGVDKTKQLLKDMTK